MKQKKDMKDFKDVPKGMILPDLEMGKAKIRKTMLDKNGMSYEVEEEIDIPIFGNKKGKGE